MQSTMRLFLVSLTKLTEEAIKLEYDRSLIPKQRKKARKKEEEKKNKGKKEHQA